MPRSTPQLTMILIAAALVLLLFGGQSPVMQYQDYRPAAAEIWSSASDVAVRKLNSASDLAADAVFAASDAAAAAVSVASSAVDAASSAFSPGSTFSTSDDPIASALTGFSAHEARMRGGQVGAAQRPAATVMAGTSHDEFKWCNSMAKAHGVQVGISWGSLPESAQLEWTTNRCDSRVVAAAMPTAETPKAVGAAVVADVSGAPGALPVAGTSIVASSSSHNTECNRDHSRVLTLDDLLCRVPKGELAFMSLANAAYGEMAVNWALLLLPVLEKVGHGDRAAIAALDQEVRVACGRWRVWRVWQVACGLWHMAGGTW